MKDGRYNILSEVTLDLGGPAAYAGLVCFSEAPVDWTTDIVRVTEPPLAAVEIFSPRQGYLEVMAKVSAYLEASVKRVWVLVPPLRAITIYHRAAAAQDLFGREGRGSGDRSRSRGRGDLS